MHNSTFLIGRLQSTPVGDIAKIVVQRPYKNNLGEYESDIVPIKVNSHTMEHLKQHCQVGDLIGVKGRIETEDFTANGYSIIVVVAEKITFLASRHGDEE